MNDIRYSFSFGFIISSVHSPHTHSHTACNSAKLSQSQTKSHHSSGSRVKVESSRTVGVESVVMQSCSHAVMHAACCIQHTIQGTSIHSAHCSGPSRISHCSGSAARMYSLVLDCGIPKLAELAKNAAALYPSALSSRVTISAVARFAMFSINKRGLVVAAVAVAVAAVEYSSSQVKWS